METFTQNHSWIDVFGERLILQMPDQMNLPDYDDCSENTFTYLIIFTDRNRIDLTLFPIEKIESMFNYDSLSILLLDKDNLFPDFPSANESDYLIQRPDEKEFLDVCNEFWWVSTYIAKGLWRGEITYAQDMLENPVRKMFMKIIEWQIGIDTNFSVSFGASGKHLKQLIDLELYEKILATYADANIENIWKSLFLMTDIFDESATNIANYFGFSYNTVESLNAINYLKDVKYLL